MTTKQKPEWDASALERISKIPFFIRPLAKRKIEKAAIAANIEQIDSDFVSLIKQDQHKAGD